MQTATPIDGLRPGKVTVRGKISNVRSYRSKKGYLVTRGTVTDSSGSVACMWFNNSSIDSLNPYTLYEFTGTYKESYGKFGLFQSTVRKYDVASSTISHSPSRTSTPSFTPQQPKKSSGGWGWLVGFAVAAFVIFGGGGSPDTTPNSSGPYNNTPASSVSSQENSTPISNTAEPTPKETTPETSSDLSNDNYYTNTYGNEVHSPAYSTDNSVPSGASARCRDGTYSFSQSRRGTCSHHGGVAEWL